MAISVWRDHCVTRHAGPRAPGRMTRASVQLIVPDTFDHDFVEADARYAEPRHRSTNGNAPAGKRDAVGDALARGADRAPRLLLLPLPAGEIRPIRASCVLHTRMAQEHRA